MVETETVVTFRASGELVENAKLFAKSGDQRMSEYIRDAVREKNERNLAQRMRFLSARLAAESTRINDELDMAAGDGIAQG